MAANDNVKPQPSVDSLALLNKADVAKRGKFCPRMVNYWMASGELPYLKLSARMVRFLPSDVEAFLQSRRFGGRNK